MALAPYAAPRAPRLPASNGRGPASPAIALVVHESDIVRAGLGVLMSGDPSVEIAEASSVYEALRMANALRPQVILFGFGAGDGPEIARLLAGLWPRPHLVALVSRSAAVSPGECLAAGADSAIAIDGATREMIVTAVHRTIEGIAPVIAGFPTERRDAPLAHTPVQDDRTEMLTRREREILYLIGEGLSNAEIADTLCLSVKTVEAHRGNVSRKLNIRSRAGLMRLAMSRTLPSAGVA